jgi:type VI secretion system protein ImpE
MTAEQSVRDGKLSQALGELQQRVRANPNHSDDRAFLFQLLAVLGQWERAATQLNMLGTLDASALITVQLYGPALASEMLRTKVFSGETTPLLIGEPPPWMALLLEALKLSGAGEYEKCAELRTQALDAAPPSTGTINGERFEWLADADTRIGPCLELIVNGKYCWVPLANVSSLRIEPPKDLSDIVWSQAAVTWTNGGQAPALIPARYPGSETSDVDAHRLARKTDWLERPGDNFFGLGQRMFATDGGEYPLFEVREIVLDPPDAST